MSWIKRPTPRAPAQPSHGWQAPHELVDDYAKRGVEIAKLNGILIQTEHMLAASRAEIRNLNAHVLDLHGRIERQADMFEEYQAQIDTMRRERDDARAQLGAADIANRNLIRNNEALARLANMALNAVPKPPAALDEAWADVAAVAGPQCPEGLIRNGDADNLVRCNLIGGHDGNHRGDRHEWPQVEVDENIEVPW